MFIVMGNLNHSHIQPATPQHQYLDKFTGSWHTVGIILEGEQAGKKITGTDRYEWMEGGFFLLHHVDVLMGGAPARALEIFCLNEDGLIFTAQGFDSAGNTSVYTLERQNSSWVLIGEKERATMVFEDNDHLIKVKWEHCTNGSAWTPWMELELKKITA